MELDEGIELQNWVVAHMSPECKSKCQKLDKCIMKLGKYIQDNGLTMDNTPAEDAYNMIDKNICSQ